MYSSLDNILSENERKEISWFFHSQNKELQLIWKELNNSIESKVLRGIITDTQKNWIEAYNNILKKRNLKKKSHIATKIKKIIKVIICFYKREETIKDTWDNIKTTFNEKINKNNDDEEKIEKEKIEKERIKQEKIIVAEKIKDYFETKSKQPLGIFKSYFLESKHNQGNFYENTEYWTKKVCEIYRREYNEEILILFQDRARGNNYLEDNKENQNGN